MISPAADALDVPGFRLSGAAMDLVEQLQKWLVPVETTCSAGVTSEGLHISLSVFDE